MFQESPTFMDFGGNFTYKFPPTNGFIGNSLPFSHRIPTNLPISQALSLFLSAVHNIAVHDIHNIPIAGRTTVKRAASRNISCGSPNAKVRKAHFLFFNFLIYHSS